MQVKNYQNITTIRTKIMRANKPRENKSTELALIEIFRNSKIKGWRRNIKLIGSPDFVFKQKKIVIFADGCFWHGHNCRKTRPNTNRDYWDKKISENKERDKAVDKLLRKEGWLVFRIWECEIKINKLTKKLLKLFPQF